MKKLVQLGKTGNMGSPPGVILSEGRAPRKGGRPDKSIGDRGRPPGEGERPEQFAGPNGASRALSPGIKSPG